jgi:hypothetical protein
MFLANALTLASQDSLVDGKAVALNGNQTAIRGDAVTNSHSDDITRHKLVGLDTRDMAVVPDHVGLVGRVLLEGSNGLLGAALLGDTNDRIENENCKNLQRIDGSMVLSDFGHMRLGG